MFLDTLRIINTRRRETILSLNQVTPMLTISSGLRTLLSRFKLRINIENFIRRGLHNIVQINMHMLMALLDNLDRLLSRIKVILSNLIINSSTSNINITKRTVIELNRTIRLQTMRINLRTFPHNMRTSRVNLTKFRNLRNKNTSNRLIRFTLTTVNLSRTTRRNVKLIKTRNNRNLTVRVLEKLSNNIKHRYTPGNTQLLLRLRRLLSIDTLRHMSTRINRIKRNRINRAIIRNLFNANLNRNRSVRIGTNILRMTLILNRMRTSIINVKYPKGRRDSLLRIKNIKIKKINNINLTAYNRARDRNGNTRRNDNLKCGTFLRGSNSLVHYLSVIL